MREKLGLKVLREFRHNVWANENYTLGGKIG